MSLFRSFWTGGSSWRQRHGAPKNRRQLFLCVLSDQLFSFPSINLLYALFWLPAILWTIITLLQLNTTMESGTAQDAIAYLNGYFIGLFPCLALTGPGKAGTTLAMRNWAAEEYTGAFRTFWKGLRGNWKQAFCISTITGMFPAILWYGFQMAMRSSINWMPSVILVAAILYLFFLLSQQVLYTLLVTYDLPLRGHLKNACIMTLLQLPRAFLVFLGSLFFVWIYVSFVLIRPNMIFALLIIPLLYYGFVGFALTELAQASFANWLRDRYLAKSVQGENTNINLYENVL